MPNISHISKASCNKLPAQVIGSKFKDRIVYNSSKVANPSSNWRADYYRFADLSYAQVLNRGKFKTNMVTQHKSQPKISAQVHRHNENITDKEVTSTQKVLQDKRTFTKQICDIVKGNKAQSKVSHHKDHTNVVCKNIYDVLPVDAVVLDQDVEAVPSNADNASSHSHDTVKLTYRVVKSRAPGKVTQKVDQMAQQSIPKVTPCCKYDLPLRIKDKSITYKHVLPDCPTLQLWEAQNKFKFGFIPLGKQLMPHLVNPIQSEDDPITLHTKVLESKKYNFLQSQITLRSQLKPDVWDHYLEDYWDRQLPLLIRFGFPMDYDREAFLQSRRVKKLITLQL